MNIPLSTGELEAALAPHVAAAANVVPREHRPGVSQPSVASAKEQFDLLHGILERYHAGFLDAALKVIASLVVACGWLITSDGASRLFGGNRDARILATIGLFFSAAVYLLTTKRLERNSKRVGEALDALNYMPKAYYRDRIVNSKVTLPYILANVLFNLFLIALVWIIGPR